MNVFFSTAASGDITYRNGEQQRIAGTEYGIRNEQVQRRSKIWNISKKLRKRKPCKVLPYQQQ